MDTKKCSKCGEIKSVGEFNKSKKEKSGLRSECRECQKIQNKIYHIKNYSGYIRLRYLRNKKYLLERQKNNKIIINKEVYFLNSVSDELRPFIEEGIKIRNLKQNLKQKRKKIEKGEI